MTRNLVGMVKEIREYLSKKQLVKNPQYEAELIISYVMGSDRIGIYLNYDKPVEEKELESIRKILRRRIRGEPLAYILGSVFFYGNKYLLNPGVLIPRPDTEILINEGMKSLKEKDAAGIIEILEVGSGSGIVAIHMSMEIKNLSVLSIDVNPLALDSSRKNLELHSKKINLNNSKITFENFDFMKAEKLGKKFRMVISNPPYVTKDEYETLSDEIKKYEDVRSLVADDDGLVFYKTLAKNAENLLEPNGLLIFEHGYLQREKIKRIFEDWKNLKLIRAVNDLNSKPRVLVYRLENDSCG